MQHQRASDGSTVIPALEAKVQLTASDSACHPFMHAYFHSFIHSFIHSLTLLLIHSLTEALSLTH